MATAIWYFCGEAIGRVSFPGFAMAAKRAARDTKAAKLLVENSLSLQTYLQRTKPAENISLR